MNIINRKTAQPFVVAVAALAVFAVATAMLLAGGVLAQDRDTEPAPVVEGTAPDCHLGYDAVITAGDTPVNLALFDVYWDTNAVLLADNLCPPTIDVHEERTTDPFTGAETVETTITRYASKVDVQDTIIHIPDSAKHTLTNNDSDRWDTDLYPFLNQSEPVQSSDNTVEVWIIPACKQESPQRGPDNLCFSFSADLLDPNDWIGPVEYHFESIREPGINPEDRGRAFVFTTDQGENRDEEILWDTDAVHNRHLAVHPDTYNNEHHWAFTKPGTYVFAVHVKGAPTASLTPSVDADFVTSEILHYTFHVGKLAELTVDVQPSNQTPTIGDTITFQVTAENEGPADATEAEIRFTWPSGLTHVSSTTETGSYNTETNTWLIGDLAAPDDPANPTTATLTATATVGPNTHGLAQDLTVCAAATEIIGGSRVNELDPHGHHHCDTATVTPVTEPNKPALFSVGTLPTEENALPGENLNGIIAVYNPDGDTITYKLSGEGHESFTAVAVEGGAQLRVSDTPALDYETSPTYRLTLEASDGKDAVGNADTSTDSSVAVQVNVSDQPLGIRITVDNLAPSLGGEILLTAWINDAPVPESQITYVWHEVQPENDSTTNVTGADRTWVTTIAPTTGPDQEPVSTPLKTDYSVTASWTNADSTEQSVTSNVVRVDWTD